MEYALARPRVTTRRIYEPAEPSDGYWILIDRLWPRGISKAQAKLDEWARQLAPSDELRRWFGHAPDRFPEFRTRYLEELNDRGEDIERLRSLAEQGGVTILYAARDEQHNNAVVLSELLLNHPSS